MENRQRTGKRINEYRLRQDGLSGLPGDTVNEGKTHIRLFVKNSLTVWPQNRAK
jgi:hypothetical protein